MNKPSFFLALRKTLAATLAAALILSSSGDLGSGAFAQSIASSGRPAAQPTVGAPAQASLETFDAPLVSPAAGFQLPETAPALEHAPVMPASLEPGVAAAQSLTPQTQAVPVGAAPLTVVEQAGAARDLGAAPVAPTRAAGEEKAFAPAAQAVGSFQDTVAPLAQHPGEIELGQGSNILRAIFDQAQRAARQAVEPSLADEPAAVHAAGLERRAATEAVGPAAVERSIPTRAKGRPSRRGGWLSMFARAAAVVLLAALPVFGALLTPGSSRGGIIDQGRSIEIRDDVSINANSIAEIQRSLILQDLAMHDEKAALRFFLGGSSFSGYKYQDQAALADSMLHISRPVDVIVKSSIEPESLKMLLSATGKRYMLPGASLTMGPMKNNAPYNKNINAQVRRRLFNDYVRDMETLVMLRSGLTSRVQANKDLLSEKEFNSMEALYYGKRGLVDGILIGYNRVITRDDMERYFKERKMGPEAIEEFIAKYLNVYELPTQPLKDFSPSSIPGKEYPRYNSPVNVAANEAAMLALFGGPGGAAYAGYLEAAAKAAPKFYVGGKLGEIAPRARIGSGLGNYLVGNVPAAYSGLLHRDTIFFHSGFSDGSADQVTQSLLSLDEKHARHKDGSHILVYVNSPGGSVSAAREMRSVTKGLRTKVDVLIDGMGASAGSWYLSSATGKRFATPNARIMFHEAAFGIPERRGDNFNELHDMLNQATKDYASIVAQASGKDFKEVFEDFRNDVWLNPVEALLYGKKGLIDAIVVGPDRIITRADVEAYLLGKLKTQAAVDLYLAAKWQEKRDPRFSTEWRPERHDENDILGNPLRTIAEVARRSARRIPDVPGFENSAPVLRGVRAIDYIDVTK